MLKIDKDSGKLLRVPRLGLRTQPLAGNCDLRQAITHSPTEFFSEIGEKLFLVGTDIGRTELRSEDEAVHIDLLGVDLNGRSVAVLIEQDRKPSSFVRALLSSEWLAAWQPQDFLERMSEEAVADLQEFLLTDVWQLNRDQRLILVAEGHSTETLWAAQNLRQQCGIDITLLRAALAVDSQNGAHYLFVRREFPATGDEWATLVRPQGESGEAVDLDRDAPFAPGHTEAPSAALPREVADSTTADTGPKQEALRTLAGGLADYLGEAIAAVDGSAELALQEAPRDPAVRRRFEEISRVVERVGKLTDELRIFAGRGARTIERLDAARLVEETVELGGRRSLPNVRLTSELGGDLPPLEGDRAQIMRVLGNLLENAVESLPEKGGAVTIRTRRLAAGRGELTGFVAGADLPPGDYLCLEVSDTGFGMDDDLKARIFDPFFTTRAPGRGLGLAAVLGIVRNHGGGLRVESNPGNGSTFAVYLPLVKTAAGSGGPAAGGIGEGHTVLVVDEQESLRTLAVQTLEADGFRVLTAADGWEALDLFAKAAETIGIVIWDAMTADLDAEEAFRAIRRIRSDTRLVVSGPFPQAQAEERFGGKLAAFVRKPLQAENLSACMRQLLAQQQTPSSAKAG